MTERWDVVIGSGSAGLSALTARSLGARFGDVVDKDLLGDRREDRLDVALDEPGRNRPQS